MNNWLKIDRLLTGSHCALCGAGAYPGFNLCQPCIAELPFAQYACWQCAAPLNSDHHGLVCGRCLKHPPATENCLSLFNFQAPVDRLIHQIKFNHDLATIRSFGRLLADRLDGQLDSKPDALIPVPLHPSRLRQRGYNQSLEIARPLSRRLGIPLDIHHCQRKRLTLSQTELNARQRRHNLRNAFSIQGQFSGQYLVIIDDVMTTGSTIWELAGKLRQAGAIRVDAWVVARASLQS